MSYDREPYSLDIKPYWEEIYSFPSISEEKRPNLLSTTENELNAAAASQDLDDPDAAVDLAIDFIHKRGGAFGQKLATFVSKNMKELRSDPVVYLQEYKDSIKQLRASLDSVAREKDDNKVFVDSLKVHGKKDEVLSKLKHYKQLVDAVGGDPDRLNKLINT